MLNKVSWQQGIAVLFLLCLFSIEAGAETDYFSDQGYRLKHYRSPTPETLSGGKVLFFSDDVQELIARINPLLINVLPLLHRNKTERYPASWLQSEKKYHIPGSIWLPNVGYAELDANSAAYFKQNLIRFSRGNKSHPLVFYCISDCWLAWNAAKRAMELGYSNIYWYRDGVDGWRADGHPVELAIPIALD